MRPQAVGVLEHPQRHRGVGLRLELQVQQRPVLRVGGAHQGPHQIPLPRLLVGRRGRIGRHRGGRRQVRRFEALQFGKQGRGVVPEQVPGHVPFGEQGLQGEIVGEG